MKTLIILGALLTSPNGFAAHEVECDPVTGSGGTEEAGAFAQENACVLQKLKATDEEKVKALADAEKDYKVKKVFTVPSHRTSSTVTYRFPELTLEPGEALFFGVPPDLAKRAVRFAIIGHRQDPATETGWDENRKWDDKPGHSSLQFHSSDPKDPWRYWRGDASGKLGAKFAEISQRVELENLYEFRKWGHAGVKTGATTTEPLYVDAMKIANTGVDHTKVSEVTLKVLPPKADEYVTHAFSEGTDFGDPETGKGQKYGGGQAYQGKFPGALALPARYGAPPLPPGWRIEGRKLVIPAPPGKRLTGVEAAVGDSHPDEVRNKDGGWGTSGWSRLSVSLRKKGGGTDTLMHRENVPPEGVLLGTPEDGCYVTQPGDELVIEASSDTAYLMALRIGWRNKEE